MRERRQYKQLVMFTIAFVIWISMVAIWAFVWLRYYGAEILRPFGYRGNSLVYATYGVLLFCFTAVYGGYKVGHYKRGDVLFSNILSMLITNIITYLQSSLVGRGLLEVVPFVAMTAADVIIISIWTNFAFRVYQHLYPPHNMLVVYGENRLTESLIYKMTKRPDKYNICKVISVEAGLDKIYESVLQYESVIICDVKSEHRNKILKFCTEHSVRTYITPKISDIIVRGATNINLFDTPLLLCKNKGLSIEQRFFKRAMDLIISGVGIVLTSPLMICTAIAIKLYDGGPVLFCQKRCTRDNAVFEIYKFRSMVVDAEKDGKATPAVDGDPRITPVGNFIRKTRLDELPQFFNIFLGQMSFVGPRPERIEHVEKYTREIPEFAFRSKVKGGLTGYAQIVGKYNTTAYDKLKMDLMYIENYSFHEDFKLILMTIKVMFMKESTEGFTEQNNSNKKTTDISE